MANVVFKRGSAVEIAAVPVTDGYILWDTTNNIMYMDNGQRRLVFGVGGVDGIRPVEYGGTGGSTPADAALSLLVDSLDASPMHVTANTDLDSYTKAGVYSCATSSIAATVANNPWTTGTFTLIVRYIESSSTLLQWIVGCCENQEGGCGWYFRACINGMFFPWQAVNTDSNVFDVSAPTLLHTDETGKTVASNTLDADMTVNGTVTAQNVIGAHFANLQDVVVCDTMPESVIAGKWYAVKGESETAVTTGVVQLPVYADDFKLNSTWSCTYKIWWDGVVGSGNAEFQGTQSTPTTVTKTITFGFELPQDATIISTKVHSKWTGTLYGAAVERVADTNPDEDGFVILSNPDVSDTSIDVQFTFKAITDDIGIHHNDNIELNKEYTTSHSSVAKVSEVYLLIEYELPGGTGSSILTPYNLYRA